MQKNHRIMAALLATSLVAASAGFAASTGSAGTTGSTPGTAGTGTGSGTSGTGSDQTGTSVTPGQSGTSGSSQSGTYQSGTYQSGTYQSGTNQSGTGIWGTQSGTQGATMHQKASDLIGKDVRSSNDEKIGKVQDVILDMNQGAAPYAILRIGGGLGLGGTRVAVPLSDLRWAATDKDVVSISATKDQLLSASATPSGAWVGVSSEEWAKNVHHFYGQPSMAGRFERQPMTGTESREFVREPQQPGTTGITTPGSTPRPSTEIKGGKIHGDVQRQVNDLVTRDFSSSQVQVTADGGTVTLRGQVDSEEQKRDIETRVKAIQGVDRVNNELTVKNQ